MTTVPISSGLSPARATLAPIAAAPRSGAETSLRLPPNEPSAVRTGAARLRAARAGWTQAQKDFEAAFGGPRAARLRDLLHAVAATELGAAAAAD